MDNKLIIFCKGIKCLNLGEGNDPVDGEYISCSGVKCPYWDDERDAYYKDGTIPTRSYIEAAIYQIEYELLHELHVLSSCLLSGEKISEIMKQKAKNIKDVIAANSSKSIDEALCSVCSYKNCSVIDISNCLLNKDTKAALSSVRLISIVDVLKIKKAIGVAIDCPADVEDWFDELEKAQVLLADFNTTHG